MTNRMAAPASRACSVLLAVFVPAVAAAQGQAIPLAKCLAQFEPIRWQLPYRPEVHVHGCAGPAGFYGSGARIEGAGGRRALELIGELTLGSQHDGMPADATFAQVQQAVFVHFDGLFQRHGFRRVELQESQGDGGRYPALATYSRASTGGPLTLTWRGSAGNAWQITLDGASAVPGR